jgi:pyridoxal phosphate enzyme (YggS family)
VSTVDPELVVERAAALRDLVDAQATRPVRIVAVTKRFGPAAVLAAAGAGLLDIGENYAQELVATADEVAQQAPDVASALRWHFIGHLQRNKVAMVAPLISWWQTVDSVRLARAIATRAPGADVLIQVNVTEAPSQAGIPLSAVGVTVDELRTLDLSVRGLMCIGAAGDAAATTQAFESVRRCADELELEECSMGMSADLREALRAGSTMIRVGTALFGPRPSA